MRNVEYVSAWNWIVCANVNWRCILDHVYSMLTNRCLLLLDLVVVVLSLVHTPIPTQFEQFLVFNWKIKWSKKTMIIWLTLWCFCIYIFRLLTLKLMRVQRARMSVKEKSKQSWHPNRNESINVFSIGIAFNSGFLGLLSRSSFGFVDYLFRLKTIRNGLEFNRIRFTK